MGGPGRLGEDESLGNSGAFARSGAITAGIAQQPRSAEASHAVSHAGRRDSTPRLCRSLRSRGAAISRRRTPGRWRVAGSLVPSSGAKRPLPHLPPVIAAAGLAAGAARLFPVRHPLPVLRGGRRHSRRRLPHDGHAVGRAARFVGGRPGHLRGSGPRLRPIRRRRSSLGLSSRSSSSAAYWLGC